MTTSFRDFVQQVKDQADIVRVISRYVPLRRSGSRHVGICPFHSDHHPSMYVTPQMGIYKCFVCGNGGDVFRFLQEYEKLSFRDALQLVAEDTGIAVPTEFADSAGGRRETGEVLLKANALAAEYFQKGLKQAPRVLKYLESRGVSPEIRDRFQVGYAPEDWEGFIKFVGTKLSWEELEQAGLIKRNASGKHRDVFVNRLIFPIWNLSHRMIAFGGRQMGEEQGPKYLNSPENALYQKSKVLYGFNFARQAVTKAKSLILVEGYMDVLALYQAGLHHVAAVSGTALTEGHAQVISRFTSKVYLFLDGDGPGRQAIERSLPVLLKWGVEVLIPSLPETEDPDSFAKKHGSQGILALLEKSQDVVDFLMTPYFKSPSGFSPEAKQRLLDRSMDILGHIESSMVRRAYTEKLAGLMEVSLELLKPLNKVQPAKQIGPGVHPFQSLPKTPEWQLLRLLLSSPELVPPALHRLELDWIPDLRARSFIDRILAFCEEEGRFKASQFYEQIPEEEKSVLESLEYAESNDIDTGKKQFDDILSELEKRWILRSMRTLTQHVQNRRIDRVAGLKQQIDFQNRLKVINNDKLSVQLKGKGSGNE